MRRTCLLLALCTASRLAAEPVDLGEFSIDPTEVTIESFRAFAKQTGRVTMAERDSGGFEWDAGWERRPGWTYYVPQGTAAEDNEPAVHVTWAEAKPFCTHAGGRLPTRDD